MKTIREVEAKVQAGLEALRNVPFLKSSNNAGTQVPVARRFNVQSSQFEEDGRKKRSSAYVSNRNPEDR